MRRGFSIYAPVVGIILASVALMIMAALVSEETARINYLKSLRASYAYLLPTQTIRYDAFTAFSVAARIWFQEAPISPDSKPDIGKFVQDFIQGFRGSGGGRGIVGVEVNWPADNWQSYAEVTVDYQSSDNYITVTVIPKGVGPTYILTLQGANGKEENLVVPIFEGKTTIYVPYPYKKVQKIAEEIREKLQTLAQEGKLAYGYCAKYMEEAEPVYVVGQQSRSCKGCLEELKSTLLDYLSKSVGQDGAKLSSVVGIVTRSRNEVNKVKGHILKLTGDEKPCDEVVFVENTDSEYCNYVYEAEVSGTVTVGDETYRFYVGTGELSYRESGEEPHLGTPQNVDCDAWCCYTVCEWSNGKRTCKRKCNSTCMTKCEQYKNNGCKAYCTSDLRNIIVHDPDTGEEKFYKGKECEGMSSISQHPGGGYQST